jgi:precorrin-4 methylase
VGNGPGIPELLTVKDQPKENNQFYRTDVALSAFPFYGGRIPLRR